MSHAKEILGGLAVLVAVLAVIAALYSTGQSNGQKEQHLTTICLQHGHTGWTTTGTGEVCTG